MFKTLKAYIPPVITIVVGLIVWSEIAPTYKKIRMKLISRRAAVSE